VINGKDDKALVNVDIQTGEVIPVEATEEAPRDQVIPGEALAEIMSPFRGASGLPVHMAALEQLPLDDDIKEELVDAYLGLEPRPFDDVVNQELSVVGVIIYQHPAYNGKDGQWHPEGYYQVRFLVILPNSKTKEDELALIVSSSTSLAMNVSYILKNPKKGWWKFPSPVVYRFSKDRNRVHHIQNVYFANNSRLLPAKEKKSS
jgi:hypothetical protein